MIGETKPISRKKDDLPLDYLLVVPVNFYKVSDSSFAVESAFAEHLKLLKSNLGSKFGKMTIIAPLMSEDNYKTNRGSISSIDSTISDIHFQPAYPSGVGRLQYMLQYVWLIIPKLWGAVRKSGLVHSGPSTNVFEPFEIIAIVFSVILGKKSIFVVDIDERNSAKMSYLTGSISTKSYLLMRYLYNPIFSLQIRFAARFCSLCLLKGQSIVEKYGKGSNVKNFIDAAHSPEYVLTDEKLKEKTDSFKKSIGEVKVTYFGRLTPYKGIKDMLFAIAHLREHSEVSPIFTIIGDGDQRSDLEHIVEHLNLSDVVNFTGAIPYGKELFQYLFNQDILLAAPLREDTPRNLFDAMASGIVTIAYDTYYYKDMVKTGAVIAVPWRNFNALALAIQNCAKDRDNTAKMMSMARDFALQNTQEVWLRKRMDWMIEAIQ